MAWRQHAAIRSHGEHFPVDKTIGTPPCGGNSGPVLDLVFRTFRTDQETPLSAAQKEQDKGVSMVEDVLKTKSSTGPNDHQLQVDVRFLDRERLGEVARAAVTRCDFLKLGKLLGADALRDRAASVETAAGRRIQR